ncbi:ABC transporter [Vibrio cholerae]|nr:protein glycosylation K [Vibrio cholerae]BCN21181.1 protein glycosylation K [Vibrio cholerae]GHX81328.1 ABC transporter [Vibrio cholerae]GIC07386.1 ABC transporter [Vibrio cholerae]
MYKLAFDFLKLFEKKLFSDFAIIIIGSFLSGMLELFGIMLIFPFIQVAMEPSSIDNSNLLLTISNIFNLSDKNNYIYIIGSLCGLSFILKDVFMLGFQYFQFQLVTRWRNELSEKFMSLYLGLNYRFHLRVASTARINTLTSTISVAVNSFLLQLLFIISYSIVAFCLLIYMFFNFLEATLITSFALGILIYFQMSMLKKANYQISLESVSIKEKNLENLKYSIEAIKETKMFLREKYFMDMFKISNRRVTDNERKINLIQYIPLYITEIIIIFCIIILVCSTIYFNDGNYNAFSGLAVLVAIAFRLTPVVNRILTSYSQIRSSMQAVYLLLNEFNDISKNQDLCSNSINKLQLKSNIELREVFFSYNEVDVLRNINIKIKRGEFIGVVGHSGSGKTTIVDILMGLLKPRIGELLIDGVIASESTIRSLRHSIGYVPQNPFIGDMSVRQNIAYGKDETEIDDVRIRAVLDIVDLLSFFEEKPDGLNFKLGEGGKVLSGGQKQRIAIARALYTEPNILVLDEATSALDVKSESDISKAIAKLKGKTTIIAIAHRLSTIRQSDRIVLVNWGEIEDIGTFDDLVERSDKFKQLVDLSKL